MHQQRRQPAAWRRPIVWVWALSALILIAIAVLSYPSSRATSGAAGHGGGHGNGDPEGMTDEGMRLSAAVAGWIEHEMKLNDHLRPPSINGEAEADTNDHVGPPSSPQPQQPPAVGGDTGSSGAASGAEEGLQQQQQQQQQLPRRDPRLRIRAGPRTRSAPHAPPVPAVPGPADPVAGAPGPPVLTSMEEALLPLAGRPATERSVAKPAPEVLLSGAKPAPEVLLSGGKTATSDVRGNLGPASVLTKVEPPGSQEADWLNDRWQAAADLSGRPIPGEHWVQIDLGSPAHITRVVLDWEDAYSTEWTLQGRERGGDSSTGTGVPAHQGSQGIWTTLAHGSDAPLGQRSKWHIAQEVSIAPAVSQGTPVRYVRLLIHAPSTQWGSSLWRLQVWGTMEA